MALVQRSARSFTRRALLRRSALTGAGLAAGLGPLRAFGQGTPA